MPESREGSEAPMRPTIQQPIHDDNAIRIMLATDNHIGYLERDPIRGQDSINSFQEILQLAVKHDVDFILLAGDLFHENRPSRDCLYKTIALLREHTMSSKPVQIELLSDPDEGKADGFSFPAINYEDQNLNIGIPVFSIHGNHDDPQGAGHEGALCALDVLSVSGLLNYMGKFDLPLAGATKDGSSKDPTSTEAGITVRPVLLQKGDTKLGLYGVGNVKDTRMHFELRSNRVRMFMPKDKDEYFNILLIHQNRVKHGPQESVPEGLFDDSVNLVVWGHEHDCRIIPEPVAGKEYYITQPGSSVATSLADGESLEKQVALLTIQGKQFDLQPITLRSVRPFVIEEIIMTEAADDEGVNLEDQMEITKFLKAKVNVLIQKANAQWDERNSQAIEDGEEELPRMLPLVRLKVDTTGVKEMSNPIRFGQEFQGRIANPRDMLVFHRSKKAAARGAKVNIDEPELSIDDPSLSASEKLAKVRVSTLVKEYLAAQELQLLGEGGMSDAIQMFVDKDDPHAITTHVSAALKNLLKGVSADAGEDAGEDDLEEALTKAKERGDAEYAEKAKTKAAKKAKDKAKAAEEESEPDVAMDSMEEDVVMGGGSDFDQEESDAPPPKKKAAPVKKAPAKKALAKKAGPAKKAPAKRGKKPVASSEEEDEDEVIDVSSEEEEAPKPVKKSRASVLSQPAKKAPAKKAAASSSKQSALSFAPAASRPTRGAASKAKAKMVVSDDDSD